MYVDDIEHLTDYIEISDSWRQKYNDPIQVPSNALDRVTREEPSTLKPFVSLKPFKRPTSYIRATSNVEPQCYDMDSEDACWLSLFNQDHIPHVAPITFEKLILAFEKLVFEGLSKLRKPVEHRIECDTSTVCDVCRLPDAEPENQMLFCDGCNTSVHQVCYGIAKVPEGSWYCAPCRGSHRAPATCALCPNLGGAFKPTTDGAWVHLCCALWVSEAIIVDKDAMEPVDLSHIPRSRRALNCKICRAKVGACIQCQVPSCTTAFHVTCAFQAKLRMELLPISQGILQRQAFCMRHSEWKNPPGKKAIALQAAASPGKRVIDLEAAGIDFTSFVAHESVSRDLRIAPKVVRAVFAYWVQKRRRQRGKPLMRQFIPKAKISRPSPLQGSTAYTHNVLKDTRLSLEYARSLCELVRRRELKKRELTVLLRSEFSFSVLAASSVLGLDASKTCGEGSSWHDEELTHVDSMGRPKWTTSLVAASATEPSTVRSPPKDQELIERALAYLLKHRCTKPFLQPVDLERHPDYKKVIKRPIDFACIKARFKDSMYATFEHFALDVDLVFENCFTYHRPGSRTFRSAQTLQGVFARWQAQNLPKPEDSTPAKHSEEPAVAAAAIAAPPSPASPSKKPRLESPRPMLHSKRAAAASANSKLKECFGNTSATAAVNGMHPTRK
eukprot:m.18792 g.18792  ORF g.18792 m.18792 type:complete len:671 (+) comp3698_c0_seq1:966-2978(+)